MSPAKKTPHPAKKLPKSTEKGPLAKRDYRETDGRAFDPHRKDDVKIKDD